MKKKSIKEMNQSLKKSGEEGDEIIFLEEGNYDKWKKEDFQWQLEERNISYVQSWTKPQLRKRLEEDDKKNKEITDTKNEAIELKMKLQKDYMEAEFVMNDCVTQIQQMQSKINQLAQRRDKEYEKMQKLSSALEFL
jgi:adenosyl cobinamide kinase/adenosyl cobinamide phosphate guanylyltransferase